LIILHGSALILRLHTAPSTKRGEMKLYASAPETCPAGDAMTLEYGVWGKLLNQLSAVFRMSFFDV
jgi:hypothetical protein